MSAAPAALGCCRACGWRASGAARACPDCGEELLVSGAPAEGVLVAATAMNGVAFLAVRLGPELTPIAIGELAIPARGSRVAVRARDDGTLEPLPA